MPDRWREVTYAYLTTTGRRMGRPHEIEIWFVLHDGAVLMISGGDSRSDWVRNLLARAGGALRTAGEERDARAVVLEDAPDHPAPRLLAAKYRGWQEGEELSAWVRDGLLVTVHPA